MTDFEKAMAAAKKLADKNGSMITEAESSSTQSRRETSPREWLTEMRKPRRCSSTPT